MAEHWPWYALLLLGAFHGLNPAMGWLFAVALGLQEGRRAGVLRALGPIAVGHGLSIALVVAFVGGAQAVAAPALLRQAGAVALILFGLYRFLRPGSHPAWVGMRLGLPELALWSFLMATAHGAGLMLFPLLLGLPPAPGVHHLAGSDPASLFLAQGGAAVLVHTLAMLAVMGAVALAVYEWVGLALLRKAWLNLDTLWALALIAAGVITLFT